MFDDIHHKQISNFDALLDRSGFGYGKQINKFRKETEHIAHEHIDAKIQAVRDKLKDIEKAIDEVVMILVTADSDVDIIDVEYYKQNPDELKDVEGCLDEMFSLWKKKNKYYKKLQQLEKFKHFMFEEGKWLF